MNITKANGKNEYELIENLKKRSGETDEKIVEAVTTIINSVKEQGDEAVREFTARFDGIVPRKTVIEKDELNSYLDCVDEDFKNAIIKAKNNIYDFHLRQAQQSWMTTKENGVIMGQRIRGLHRVGIYVPGGTAAYPSSVLMNAIPAKIAGVKEIIMVTPPGKDGNPNPDIMAAAAVAGVDRVFLVGGAQAVAALAFGTEKIPKVDKIVGPGNIFVATAKKLLYGVVDIDMIAGPSEILIVADKSAKASFLAADLMSQAEHDVRASAILLTTSAELARATAREIDRQIKYLERQEIIEKSLNDYGEIIVCENLDQAIENELAPEHLEMCVEEPLNISAGLIMQAVYFSATSRLNRSAIILQAQTMFFRQAVLPDFFLHSLLTVLLRKVHSFIILKMNLKRHTMILLSSLIQRGLLHTQIQLKSDLNKF